MLNNLKRIFRVGPTPGEATRKQAPSVANVGGINPGLLGDWGYGLAGVPRGSYATYRLMRTDPTLAMAKAAAFAPIKAAGHSWEMDDDAPPGALELVQRCIDPQWKQIVRLLLLAVEYGWAGGEIVWKMDPMGRLVLERVKPLLHDITTILIDAEHGNYNGLRNSGEDLSPEKALIHTYDGEAGDFYGRSRYENLRIHVWAPWTHLERKWRNYIEKATGIIPMVEYPLGQGLDASGNTTDTSKIAMALLQALGRGEGVAMPREFAPWAEQMIAKGNVDPATISNWVIKFVEVAPGHGTEIVEMFRYFDSLKCRGFLTPERTILEGQHGTLAEAEAHTDVALAVADDVLGDIVDCTNRQVVDVMLVQNFGAEAKGKVRLKAAPIVDDERAFVRQVMSAILTNPSNADLFMATIDLDAAIDEAGLPKARENIGLPLLGLPKVPQVPGAPVSPKPPTPGPLSAAMRKMHSNGRLARVLSR